MKKKFRSLLALMMALAMVLALAACGSSSTDTDTVEEDASVTSEEDEGVVVYDIDSSTSYVPDTSADYEEEPWYIEVAVGDVLYSDDNCTITIASLETTDDGGSTLTLGVDSTYEGSLAIDVSAFDTDKYNTFLEKDAADEEASVETKEALGYITVADEAEDDEDGEWAYEFSGEYIYYSVYIYTYSELLTKEQADSAESVDLLDQDLYMETILINAAE